MRAPMRQCVCGDDVLHVSVCHDYNIHLSTYADEHYPLVLRQLHV